MKRLLLIPLGALLGLVVLEAGLQVAAWVTQAWVGRDLGAQWLTGNVRILCLGDSNTYGVRVPRDRTWPAQLEARWNETIERPRIEVLNLGFPGTNSSRIVRDLPRLLDLLQPDLILLMVGVNDFWTVPFPTDAVEDRRPWRLLEHLRIHRLYHLLRRGKLGAELESEEDPDTTMERGGFRARVGEDEFEMSFAKATTERRAGEAVKDLRRNLGTIVDTARRRGVPLRLMTYPARLKAFYPFSNRIIRQTAAETGVPLIDLTATFEPLCPELKCPEYLLDDDHHPNPRGYGVVAETVAAALADLARERPQEAAGPPGASGPSRNPRARR